MDELILYDRTRDELRRRLSGKLSADFDLEDTLTAYAYWVCTVVRNRGKDWETTVQEYVDFAIRKAVIESQAEQIELSLLRPELRQASSPLLDVGAGWGRLHPLYLECGLQVVYVEPSNLGCQLLRRNGLCLLARGLGQSLSFPACSFRSAMLGWVLHHDAPDVPASAILSEIARVMTPNGRLLSVEPLTADFDAQKWRTLIVAAGFEVEKQENFFELSSSDTKNEQYAYLTAVRRLA